MATTTQDTNRAKFLELRQAGKSVAEARNATYWPPPVVADQTPAPVIPVTPAPITNQEVQMGVNAVWGTAEQRRETRANITAWQTIAPPPAPTSVPTRTPETPVETHPPVQGDTAPVTPKVDATPWITQDAFQQAKIESEKIKAQNDAVMAQNQQKSELARQDEAMKAEALIPKNEKDVLNALIGGISVPKQNTQAYRNAELKANNYRKYASMTPTQLLDNMKMGEISSEMDQLLASNPNYAQAKQKLNEFQKTQNLNKTMSNIVNGMKGKEVATVTPEQDEVSISDQLMKKYGLDDANASAFAQFVATDEEMADNKAKLLANKNALSSVNRQINETTTLLNQGIKDLKAQYPDMSASGIITLMWSRLGEFNDAITNLNSTRSLLQADIKDEMDLAKSAFDAKSSDIQAQWQIRSALALGELKSAQEKADAEAALKDPKTQIKATMDEFAKLGIIAQWDLTSKIAEFKASGKTLPEYITGLRKQFMSKPEYKKYLELQSGQLSDAQKMTAQQNFDIQKIKLQDSMKDKNIQRVWWTDSNPIYWYVDGNKVVTVSVPWSTTTGATATGNIVPVTAGNKTVRLDQVGASGFENAINQLKSVGLSIVVWEGARNQTATIKSMADRYGIPFNASNPAETAQKLRSAGHQVADPWKSNHESGMAIDVYGSSKLDAVTPAQEKILNANWWYSAGIPWDAGHFEYRGGTTGTESTTTDIPAYQKYLNSWALPTGIKAGTPQANEWLQGYSQWKSTANPLSDSVQKRVDSYSDDYSKNANVVSAFKFAPLLRQYDKVKVSDLSSSQRQGIISDYAKALDPDSVVREWEYATVAKYSSSWGEKTLSEINQFLSWNGTLSDASAQKVIDAIKSRGKNYVEQEKNIRNQYIEKINRATGYKDWDTQLVYPDYSTPTTQSNSKLSALSEILAKLTQNAPKQ